MKFTHPPLRVARGRVGEGAKSPTDRQMRDSTAQQRARVLRKQATDAERYFWQYLRRRQFAGFRFRRQVPISGYIADFACLELKLIIELDGSQHQQRHRYDERRDSQLQAQGFRVLRFWDNQVFQETQAVLDAVLHVLQSRCPHPNLPPHAGEGN